LDISREIDKAMDMMAGGICIIDIRKVVVISGPISRMLWHVFLQSEGFIRFFLRYYSLIIDWVKKGG
jgi:hypothetical protein